MRIVLCRNIRMPPQTKTPSSFPHAHTHTHTLERNILARVPSHCVRVCVRRVRLSAMLTPRPEATPSTLRVCNLTPRLRCMFGGLLWIVHMNKSPSPPAQWQPIRIDYTRNGKSLQCVCFVDAIFCCCHLERHIRGIDDDAQFCEFHLDCVRINESTSECKR